MTAKILAVNDSRTMRNMVKSTLLEAGFDVELAETGSKVLNGWMSPLLIW